MKITIKNLQKKIPIKASTQEAIRKIILNAFFLEGIKKIGDITVCLMDDKSICELNLNYLGQNRPTDVMVFDFSESGTIAADIAISTDTAVTNSWVFKNTPLQELYLYVAHGILHLLGYDDKNDRGKRIMQEKAKLALNRIGVRIRE